MLYMTLREECAFATDGLFADDCTLVTHSEPDLQTIVDRFS